MTAPSSDQAAIKQTIRALAAAGYDLASVFDGEDDNPVLTEGMALAYITAVDEAWLYVTKDGPQSWVRFVLGNDPEEVICDHSVDLSPVLDPLTAGWF